MKKTMIILAAILMAGSQLSAQVVQENEAVVVYYMPKTTVTITLNYEVIEEKPGIFYQYAERYLGTENIILEANKSYRLTDASCATTTTADTNRAYKVTSQKGFNSQLLTLSADGRLLGYNVELEAEIGDRRSEIGDRIEEKGEEKLMPLLEEQFMAGSIAKMAEGAAKQIYRIRETRLNLLAGDVEHMPADGKAMQLVLEELTKQEQTLVELFVGTRTIKASQYTFCYHPNASIENEVVCRLSQHTGIVNKDDLSGEPIYLTLEAKTQSLQPIAEVNSKAPALSQLYYNLPGTAKICITHKSKVMTEAEIQVAQYGVAIPLALELFTGKTPIIRIHPKTGNILSIQK